MLLRLAEPVGPAAAQMGFGSPGVPNIGPPEDALFPDLAAMQDRLEEQGWLVRGQATFVLQGHPLLPLALSRRGQPEPGRPTPGTPSRPT